MTAIETTPTEKKCPCGKPAAHLTAPEDSADWACRVPDPQALLTAREVVDLYPLSVPALDRWRLEGCGPRSFTVAGRVLYPRGDLDAWCARVGVSQGPRKSPEPAAGAVECKPWCEYGDGHAGATYRADQCCYSPQLRVELSTHLRIEESVIDGPEWVPGPDYVNVHAQQVAGEDPRICISHAGEDDVFYTRDEARQLVEALQLLLGQIEAQA